MNQRWRQRRDTYRPAGEVINTRSYEIAETNSDRTVREFIALHHYLQTTPPARFRFCLYKGQQIVGVAVFAHPTNDRSITGTLGCAAVEGVELSRLVLLDEVPGNGESYFVGHCLRQLKRIGLAGVVTFSDPMPRKTVSGAVIKVGHVGTVYQSLNARFVGRSCPRSLRMLADGSILSDRTIQKLRSGEPGTRAIRYALANVGLSLPEGPVGAELSALLDKHTRSVRHPGNFKYVWCFSRAGERNLPSCLPYPKLDPLFHIR
jgi:hypothetical protein